LYVAGKPTIDDMSIRMPRRGAALGVAAGGVLVGHWLTYLIVSPVAAQRTALLARTGHAYLGAADQLGLALTLVALATIFLGRLTRGNEGPGSVAHLAPRLAAFQMAAFLAMEIAERIAAGASVGQLFHGPVLPVGFAVQAAVAAVGAAIIVWILRAARAVAAVLGESAVLPSLGSSRLLMAAQPVPARVHFATPRGRGPPTLI
jgi:hypothetical protein